MILIKTPFRPGPVIFLSLNRSIRLAQMNPRRVVRIAAIRAIVITIQNWIRVFSEA